MPPADWLMPMKLDEAEENGAADLTNMASALKNMLQIQA